MMHNKGSFTFGDINQGRFFSVSCLYFTLNDLSWLELPSP